MKKLKTILSMFILLFAFVSLSININAEDSSGTNQITMTSRSLNEKGHAIDYTGNGEIQIVFKGFAGMEGTATIKYSTMDGTAIASTGDYEKASGTIYLSASHLEETITIKVGTTKFSVLETKDDVSTSYVRSFKFMVTSFSYDGGTINQKEITCEMNYRYSLEASYTGGNPHDGIVSFDDYWEIVASSDLSFEEDDYGDTDYYFDDNQTVFKWLNYYVNTGLADIYGGMEAFNLSRGASTSDSYISLHAAHGETLIEFTYSDVYLNEENDTYFLHQLANSTSFKAEYRKERYTRDDSLGRVFNGVKLTDKTTTTNVQWDNCTVFIHVDNTGPWRNLFGTIRAKEVLADVEAPHPVQAYGLANNSAMNNGSIRVAVRFNEPVQINPSIASTLYLKATFTTVDRYLKYVEGSGTDTLVFEMDKDSAPAHGESITLKNFYTYDEYSDSFTETNEIYDYSNYYHTVDMKQITGETEFDFSDPTFVDVYTKDDNKIASSRKFTVELDNVKAGNLYYLFSDYKTLSTELTATNQEKYLSQFQNYATPMEVSDSSGLATIYATDKDGNLFNSPKYLHIYVLSENGRGTYFRYNDYGGIAHEFLFDSINPKISITKTDAVESYTNKNYEITIEEENLASVSITGVKETSDLVVYGFWTKFSSSVAKDTLTITLADLDIPSCGYGYFDFEITATDKAGNSFTYSIDNQFFDSRDVFDVDVDVSNDEGAVDKESISIYEEDVYQDIYQYSDSLKLTYVLDSAYPEDTLLEIKYLMYGNKVLVENGVINSEYLTLYKTIIERPSEKNTIYLKPSNPGFLEIVFMVAGETKESICYSYYFTNNFSDDTVNATNIENANYVKNYVFSLGSTKYYYFSNEQSAIVSENYSTDGTPFLFSKKNKAYDYVLFCEMQDMDILYLDNSDATKDIITWLMNRSYSTGYAAAKNETTTPEIGQYWVRYKEHDWDFSTNVYSWAYYYLGTSPLIDVDHLPTALDASLAEVSNRIAAKGSYLYYTGASMVNNVGYPNISNQQIISKDLSVSSTKCSIEYANKNKTTPVVNYKTPLTMQKDTAIFEDYTSTGTKTKLLMHYYLDYTTDPTGRLFYKKTTDLVYKAVSGLGEKELDSLLGTGYYDILELGVSGAKKITVYVDKEAPVVHFDGYKAKSVIETDKLFMQLNIGSYSYQKIRFTSIDDMDMYSYIHISSTSDKTYSYDCLLKDFKSEELYLTNGEYLVYISDRYGNSIQASLFINNTELDVAHEVIGESYALVEVTNRTADEIISYQVYVNEILYTSTYTKSLTIYDSGTIRYVVTDIYNNQEKGEFDFTRKTPSATWSYYENNVYKEYSKDLENPLMRLEKPSDKDPSAIDDYIFVRTSILLDCSFDKKYTYKFIGEEPDFTITSDGYKTKTISFNQLTNWTLVIYYPDDEKTKVTYICLVDNSSPTVQVVFDSNTYITADSAELDKLALAETEEGKVLEVTTDKFKEISSVPIHVKNGETVYSNSLRLDISDNIELRYVSITLNGKLIKEFKSDIGQSIETIELKDAGEYQILAKDIFGNVTELSFTNSADSIVKRLVDDEISSSFDGSGNTSDTIEFNSNGVISYLVKTATETRVYTFIIKNDGIYEGVYKTVRSKDTMTWTHELGTEVCLKNTSYIEDEWYNTACSQIQVKYTSNSFVFNVLALDTKTEIEYTYVADIYAKALTFTSILSKEKTDITLINKTEKDSIATNQEENLILVHDEFEIDYASLSEDVSSIEFGYSKTNTTLDNYELKVIDFKNFEELTTKEDGFYVLRITNAFGNVLVYYLSKFVDINVETTVEYSNLDFYTFSSNYTKDIYSNKQVTVSFYDTTIYQEFKVEKLENDAYVELPDMVTPYTNMYSVVLNEEGIYRVKVIDSYGNIIIRNIEIKKEDISYDDSYVVGYNKDALSKYYSNTLLSIDKDAILAKGIVYVKVMDTIVYDSMSEDNPVLDDTLLNNCIGEENARKEYTVVFRDKYGNECKVVLHYSSYSTIHVSKNYKNVLEYEEVEPTDDIYSNSSIQILSDATTYTLSVDGVLVNNSILFSYSKDGNYTNHSIEYVDEYGFKHSFNIHILRQDIKVNVITDYTMNEIDGLLTVAGSFKLSYTQDSTCTYSINDTGSYDYTDEVISNAGIYYFTVRDESGNMTTLRIKLDNSCEYEFVSNSLALYPHQVVTDTVRFNVLNDDSVSIVTITKDGNSYEVENNTLNEHGYYQVSLKDAIGNESSFDFYLITKKQKSFKYQVPEGYAITEIFIEIIEGYKDMYTEYDSEGFDVKTDGKYTVVLKNLSTNVSSSFSFVISNVPPKSTLVGVENNSSTKDDVVIDGLEAGDEVLVYRNGSLYASYSLDSEDKITITEPGNYEVTVTNEAGVSISYSFKKEFVMNTAGSILIIVLLAASATVLLVGLMLRRRSKVDK